MDAALNRRRLGELLVEEGFLTEQELAAALAEQTSTGRRLGEILVGRGVLSGPALANILADQYGGTVRTEYGIATGFRRRLSRSRGGGDATLLPLPAGPAPHAATAEGTPDAGTDLDAVVARLEAKLAETGKRALATAEASAKKDRRLQELAEELDRTKRELDTLRDATAGDGWPARGAAELEADEFVAVAPLGDRWGTTLCRGAIPALGAEVELRDAPGVRFAVARYAWQRCVYLEPLEFPRRAG